MEENKIEEEKAGITVGESNNKDIILIDGEGEERIGQQELEKQEGEAEEAPVKEGGEKEEVNSLTISKGHSKPNSRGSMIMSRGSRFQSRDSKVGDPDETEVGLKEKLIIYKNGDFAKGTFNQNNEREGKVVYYNTKGFRLEGSFKNNKRQGPANIKFSKGEFKGSYKEDKKDGLGIFDGENETYTGEFKDGYYDGYGRYIDTDGWIYEGYWKEGKKDGFGVEILPGSDLYIGEFKRDKKDGLGLYLFAQGGFYYGIFRKGEKSQMGVLYTQNQKSYYFGEFINDKKSGRGYEYYPDGSKYDGYFESNQREGPGIMDYATGAIYMGEWKSNSRHGKGRMEKSGIVTSGNWEYNRYVLACAVDLDDVLNQIYSRQMPLSLQGYLSDFDHEMCPYVIPQIELNALIEPPFILYVRDLNSNGIVRGPIFRTLRTLTESKTSVKEFSKNIYKIFSTIPDANQILNIFKGIIPPEFESGKVKFEWSCLSFGDRKRQKFKFDNFLISGKKIK